MYRTRYFRIVLFFARLILSIILWDLIAPRFGLRKWSRSTRPRRLRQAAIAYRKLAIQMGGVLIKVGQFLSTRVDVLPSEVTAELSGLQDEVPPVPFYKLRKVADAELGAPLEEKFAEFDPTPLAAASLGQVHHAWLNEPAQVSSTQNTTQATQISDVVVKIQRPDIEKIINTDLAALETVAGWLHRYPPIRRRANVIALQTEFKQILLEEIDYIAEGRNAEIFRDNFQDHPEVRVPRVIWSLTTRRVLTLENVLAIKITDYATITQAGVSRAEVASRLLNTYLKQIFEDGFFHADPHPGNLFVEPLPPSGALTARPWRLTFIDFGMVGRVPANLRIGLREMLIGVGTRDSARVVQAYQMMGLLLPSADLEMIEKAGARVFERYWGKNMTELTSVNTNEMKEFADEFRDLIYDLPFQIPQNVIFLGRCVGILSGMCTGLDPQFNLWEHLAPYAQKIMAEEIGTRAQAWLAEIEKLARLLWMTPQKVDRVLSKLESGEVAVRTPELTQQVKHLETAVRQATSGIIFAALLLAGVNLYLGGEKILASVLLIAAILILANLWRTGGHRDHQED